MPAKFYTTRLGGHLFIFDCCIPLNIDTTPHHLNFDRVDIRFHLADDDSDELQFKGCGIQLHENNAYMGGYETEESQECGDSAGVESSPDTLSHVCEGDHEENVVNDGCHETEKSNESVGSEEETQRNSKRMRIT